MATPQITGPDNVLRESVQFSTTLGSRFFTGTMDANTVDMEISIRGGGYTSDPHLIIFEGTDWTVPNPAAYPDGLELVAGENSIKIRALSTTGSTSDPAEAVVTLVQERDLGVVASPPTNITMTQQDADVLVKVEEVDDDYFQGFNFYASVYAGGGSTGYSRINLNTVTVGEVEESTTPIASTSVDADIATDPTGAHVADPLYVTFLGTQTDNSDTVLQTDFDLSYEVSENVDTVRTALSIVSVEEVTYYSFTHNRRANANSTPATVANGSFAATPNSDPLYYVLTAVYYNPTDRLEFESSYSAEVVGRPLRVRAVLGNFPTVSRQQLVRETITSIFRSNPQVRVEEGSFLRDTFIDPFASEAERLRFILDFLHRAQSFAGLLKIDDPNNTGTSQDVARSAYKQALKQSFYLSSDAEVQSLVNLSFERLASNFGVYRLAGSFARGEVTFYTSTQPARDLTVSLGDIVSGGSTRFQVTKAGSIPYAQRASHYNPSTGRYTVRVSVQATSVGSTGNVGAGQITSVVSGATGLSVVNASATFGGSDQETNKQLAERAARALASVDSGTEQGYHQTSAAVAGVTKALVVDAGDAMMMRDLDASGTHRGGKVDVWVQGTSLAEVTDTFAFTFSIGKDIQFEMIGDPANYEFRAVDDTLSQTNPIIEMLDNAAEGYSFRNASTGDAFDLTGVTITSYNIIQLSTSVVQPAVDLTDVVLGDYRRRNTDSYTLSRQPVSSLTSVQGSVSGVLDTDAYDLYHPYDPLSWGRSTLAADYVKITGTTDSSGDILPSGDTITVTDEEHVMLGEYLEYLDNLGANYLTVEVWNEDRTIQYRGPNDSSGVSDFTIVDGDETTALSLRRITTGNIASGQTVLVDYQHDENFTVTYQTNLVVSVTQEDVNAKRHVTADVLVKDAIPVPVDIQATVVLKSGTAAQAAQDQSAADQDIRTAIENLFEGLRGGDPVRQSDIVGVIEPISYVSYVVIPLTTMVRAEDALVVREFLATDQAGDGTYVTAWSTSTVSVWLIEDELSSATTDGGGPETEFRGVFQDDVALTLEVTTPSSLGNGAGRSYIIGKDGVSINGISDDVTLTALGYTTEDSRNAARAALTGNRVLISTTTDESLTSYQYRVTYVVGEDSGPKNIDPGATSYLTVGTLEFTYDYDSDE